MGDSKSQVLCPGCFPQPYPSLNVLSGTEDFNLLRNARTSNKMGKYKDYDVKNDAFIVHPRTVGSLSMADKNDNENDNFNHNNDNNDNNSDISTLNSGCDSRLILMSLKGRGPHCTTCR